MHAWALSIGLIVSSVASTAVAQRVLLMRPATSDTQVLAALAHLQGELTVHHFTAHTIDAIAGPPATLPLDELARTQHVDAIIVLTVDVETVRAILWQPSPLGATGTQVSIEMSSRAEGPRALAVRVVDMLRARLAEPAEPREVPLAQSPPDTPQPAEHGRTTASAHSLLTFMLEAHAFAQLQGTAISPAFGPSLALGARVSPRFAALALAQLPFSGPIRAPDQASAALSQQQLFVELRVQLWAARQFSFHARADAGTQHLSVQGKTSGPYLSRHDDAWTALTGAGLGGELRVFGPLSLSLGARMLLLSPRPVVHVGNTRVRLLQPFFQLAAGLHVSL